jgi:predicted membrane channel-forming protein YqfA (hemolysin III family)
MANSSLAADTIWSRQFWKNVLEMAVSGAAMGVGFAMPNPHHPDWVSIVVYAGAGALALAAKSIVANLSGAQRATTMVTVVEPKRKLDG